MQKSAPDSQFGHYLANHDRYHELNGGNPPCNGFNWLLWYVAAVLAPGFKDKVRNSTPGGTFVEGVIWEWMVEGDTTLSSHWDCPKLLGHLKKIRNWERCWLCTAYIQQDPNRQRYVEPPQGIPAGQGPSRNPPKRPAMQTASSNTASDF